MKTKLFLLPALILMVLLVLCFTSAVSASADDDAAYLYELGLFKGTENGFELDKQATRIEALVMLIRLLGKEQEALQQTSTHPFGDVPSWADKYVAYSYVKGITSGITSSTFGSRLPISDQQYFTFILRALAYDDKKNDFVWNQARQ